MSDQRAKEIWLAILQVLDEKMQYGFLEQAKSVVDIKLEGSELTLVTSDQEAEQFFSAEVNQQRLFIVARPIAQLDRVKVLRVDAEPLR